MTVGSLNLTVFTSALFCFGIVAPPPSQALPDRPWYLVAFDGVLRVVSSDGQAMPRELEKQLDQTYTSRVTKEQNTITLRGNVPSESDLKILQGVAAATSPGATLVDKSRINANVPDRDAWLAGMTFALRQLGKLENGNAVLRNASIAIDGVTKADDDFAAIQKKLRDEAPKGLNLEVALKPHDVHPFVWLAQLQHGTLTLSGHVPDQQDKVLCGYAEGLFHNLKVNNSMEFAKGEPQDWLVATKLALDMLALLYTGNVAVVDNVVKLEGIYSSPGMVDLLKTYAQRMPRAFRLETNILEPVARAPAARAEDVSLAARGLPASMSP
jgi:hypothetical protein